MASMRPQEFPVLKAKTRPKNSGTGTPHTVAHAYLEPDHKQARANFSVLLTRSPYRYRILIFHPPIPVTTTYRYYRYRVT